MILRSRTRHAVEAAIALVFAAILLSSALAQIAAPHAQSPASQTQFAPLEKWKAAVLSGNEGALRAFYSIDPPAVTVISKSENHNPEAEPQFWLAAKANGLRQLKLRIAKQDSPQPGVLRVMFQLEADMNSAASAPKVFAAIAQYWLKRDGKWFIVVTHRTALARLPQPVVLLLPQPKGDNPGSDPIYPNSSEAKSDIAAALAAASRDHKRVLLDFGGNWCSDCHILNAAFHYPDVARILRPNFVVVDINIGQYDENLDLAEKYQIPLKKGVPSLAVLDSKGNLLVSQKQGDFENTAKIDLHDVERFLNTWKP